MRAWLVGGVVGLVALAGLFVAATAHGGFWPYAGIVLFALAVLLLFRLIGRAFEKDGRPAPLVPVPERQATRLWLAGLLALAGVAGLFIAAGAQGGPGYYLGLILAGAAWLYVFRLIAASIGR
jgi:hypothetical protein